MIARPSPKTNLELIRERVMNNFESCRHSEVKLERVTVAVPLIFGDHHGHTASVPLQRLDLDPQATSV